MRNEKENYWEWILGRPFEEIVREGARRILSEAVLIEVEEFIRPYEDCYDSQGRKRIVKNGYHKPRKILWGGGKIEVQVPRIRDREGKLKHQSRIIPPYLRRVKSMDEYIPYLYLKGISTGDFSDVLSELVGEKVSLSSSTVVNLKKKWQEEYSSWHNRDLSQKEYIYWWADGVHFNVRLEDDRVCMLIIIGVTPDGKKELVAVHDGYRESKLSWQEVLLDLKRRGLKKGPRLAIGDGALGFWAALREEFPQIQEQRCWVHKTANVLDKMPKSLQPQAKRMIHGIYLAPTKEEANKSFDDFIRLYEAKCPRAVSCLLESKEETMAFYDYPAEHWRHIRSTNPIESTFATVRLRTKRTKGCGSRVATLMMVFKLVGSAEKRWQRIHSSSLLQLVKQGQVFEDGLLKEAA